MIYQGICAALRSGSKRPRQIILVLSAAAGLFYSLVHGETKRDTRETQINMLMASANTAAVSYISTLTGSAIVVAFSRRMAREKQQVENNG